MVLDRADVAASMRVGYKIVAQIIGRDRRRRGRRRDGQPGGRGRRDHENPARAITQAGALILEIVFTAIFLTVILTSTKKATLAGAAGHPR